MLLLWCGLVALFALGALWLIGLGEPQRWTDATWIAGFSPDGRSFVVPPFGVFQAVTAVQRGGSHYEQHLYVLGSDAGGRDLLALMARGSTRSILLVIFTVAS